MLTVVRHGQTAANAQGLLLGRLDPSLDVAGRDQAAAVAAALAPLPPDARIIASPLARCRETATVIANSVGERPLEVEVDERWIELDYGDLDGTPLADIPADLWRQWRADSSFAPPGGESLRDLGARVASACRDLLDDAADRDIVVVSHVSPIKAAVAWALGVGDDTTWRMYVAPGSITRIQARPTGPVLAAFNVTPWSPVHGGGRL